MTESLDEVSTEYGSVGRSRQPSRGFLLGHVSAQAEANGHDGKPVTPDDVIFSLNAFKQASSAILAYYRHVVKAEKSVIAT